MEKNESNGKEIPLHRLAKPDSAPPLPRKKRPNVPSSKQEKEVENQTEKNRCITIEKDTIDVSPSNSLLSKPRIAKLKALFERSPTSRERNSKNRGSQTVSRSHSLGAVRKPLEISESDKNKSQQPIPDGGKLKVPKLSLSPTTTVMSRPVPLIKRSKSLKIVSQPPVKQKNKSEVPSKPKPTENKHETLSRGTLKKSITPKDIFRIPETKTRRRSLESLMGDEPPVITWPTAVMTIPKTNQKTTAESIKHQFQHLTTEAQKKVNMLASGIGVRERRNSFRQAISKDNVKSPYEKIWLDPKKNLKRVEENNTIQVDGYPKNFNESLTVRNQNGEILQPVPVTSGDQVDGVISRKEPVRNNYERIDIVNHNPYVLQRAKTQVMRVNSELSHVKYPQRSQELTRTLSSVPGKDERKVPDSKNLFLHRLNIEIQEEQNFREREMKNKARSEIRSWYMNSDEKSKEPNVKNPNFLGIHAYGKETPKTPKYNHQSLIYIKSSNPESQSTKSEIPPHRTDRAWLPSKPVKSKDDLDSKTYSNEFYATSYDLYATVNSKKIQQPRKTQIVEIRGKNVNFPSGSNTNSLSSHSSGDMSHSDQHSRASDSPKVVEQFEDKVDVLRAKTEGLKIPGDKRAWGSEYLKQEESESSSSSSARELSSVMNSKPADYVYNYGEYGFFLP